MSKKHDKDFLMSRKYATFVVDEYAKRIEKAIEYIRSEYIITDDDVYLALYSSDGTLDKLENILQGEEKE